MSFRSERRVFERLKTDCTESVRTEYQLAVHHLVERYNTTIHENRFVVGGAVEVFTYALLRSVGIDCTLYGDQSAAGDILLPNDHKLSVKSSFRGVTSVKLVNQMGGGSRPWETATLFVISGVGIVYGDPDMVDPTYVRATGDGTELRAAGLRELIADPSNVMPVEITAKPPTEMTGFSHKASTTVARQILFEIKASNLLNQFGDSPESS